MSLSVTQPALGSQVRPLHVRGVPAVQVPPWQVSSPLQTVSSSQDDPSTFAVNLQPLLGSQLSVVHGLPSEHWSGLPLVQNPCRHVSSPLQAWASAQHEPSGGGVPGLHFWFRQLSIPWQMLPSSQAVPVGGGAPGAHTPLWQVSCPLHGSWSPQFVPLTRGTCLQPTVLSHESTVHSL